MAIRLHHSQVALFACFMCLREYDRWIVFDRVYHKFTFEQIAGFMGWSLARVRASYRRSIAWVIATWKHDEESGEISIGHRQAKAPRVWLLPPGRRPMRSAPAGDLRQWPCRHGAQEQAVQDEVERSWEEYWASFRNRLYWLAHS